MIAILLELGFLHLTISSPDHMLAFGQIHMYKFKILFVSTLFKVRSRGIMILNYVPRDARIKKSKSMHLLSL